MAFIDITRPLHPGLAVWPGDTPMSVRQILCLKDGDSVNLGTLTMSLHAGTHVDAPRHFTDIGDSSDIFAEQLSPELFCGPALLVHVQDAACRPITVEDLAAVKQHRLPRLLIRTDGWPLDAPFPEAIPTLAPDVPLFLKECGVRLLGLDVPSVDAIDSKTLDIHHALHAAEITFIESLTLADAAGGVYELIALPLPIKGADAAPVRALLKEL
jgi:arylformamidase